MTNRGPYTPRRRCLAAAIVAAFNPSAAREPSQPDGCPKKAATFLAALGTGYLGGRGIGRVIAGRYDRHT